MEYKRHEKLTNEYCKRYILACRDESEMSKDNRMSLNRDNFSMYQLEHDFNHKAKGQSKEILSKVRNSVEQIKAFFQQALADLDDWWSMQARDGSDGSAMLIRPEEAQKLTNYMLKTADYFNHIGKTVQLGLLGSLSITRVHGEMYNKPRFTVRKEGKNKGYRKSVEVEDQKAWRLRFDEIRQEDYYPDPLGDKLYEIAECELDMHIVKALAEGDDAIYNKAAVEQLKPWGDGDLQREKRARETGQNNPVRSMRPRVKITELYGNIIDEETGDILLENCLVTLANDDVIIREPVENPHWHQRSTIVAAALIEVANSVWGIALMDAGTKHNRSLTELFNLMLDSAMKTVWGINQIRIDDLADPKQITDGIAWGTNLKINSSMPPGTKVMEPVVTGEVSGEVFNLFNLLNQETLTSMMTNDLRMGAQSMRAVKATEVVAAENSITSVFQGIAKNFEEKKVQPELELTWLTIAQNWDLIDRETFISLFGRERGEQLAGLSPQDIFVETVNGFRFEVFGISKTLRRQADFRKWTTLLQIVGGSEVLIEAFLARYSFEKLMGEIMTSIDIDKSKIEQDQQTRAQNNVGAAASISQPGGAPGALPDMMSQTPAPPSASSPLDAFITQFPRGTAT